MSPYRYPNYVPKVAKNWTASEKKRCTRAANAVLRDGGSEEEAIFACIHAAGKGKKQYDEREEEEYEELCEEASQEFQEMLVAVLSGALSIREFSERFRDRLRIHFSDLMLLGLQGEEFTERHREILEQRLEREYEYFDGFEADIREALSSGVIYSDRLQWRSSLYGYARAPFIAGTIPVDITFMMPYLPGDDCLGGSLCRCHLEYDEDDENYLVYWVVDPASESCIICLGHEADSPYVFSKAEVHGLTT